MMRNINIFTLVYEGDETAPITPPVTPPVDPPPDIQQPNDKLKFTPEQQKFFNDQMQKERRKLQEQNQKTVADLQKLQQSTALTQKEKIDLQSRIEELNTQFLSKEELLKKDAEKIKKEKDTELQKVAKERDIWKHEYAASTIHRNIVDAAAREDAFNSEQIVAILRPVTRLVQVMVEGKPTGKLTTMVKMQDVDSEGKPIMLDLTVTDAVKRMKDLPERFGNLFKSGVAGGLGQNNGQQTKKIDPSKMTQTQFIEWRKKNLGAK